MIEEMYLNDIILVRDDQPRLRHLPFSGAKNFRDLGGYQTVDGKSVRWGMLYRSDALHKLTSTDIEHLSALSLDRVIDFRAEHESKLEPDRLPAGLNIRRVHLPISDSSTRIWYDSREEMIRNLKREDASKYMLETNRELATRFTPEIRKFFLELFSAEGSPVLFHCAAGKDRTGFAAAILLQILGVPQQTIMEDYLLTNQYLLPAYRWNLTLGQFVRGKKFIDGVRAFMEARPEYLLAAFEAINQNHHSFENYIRDGLGLSDQDIEYLKILYLE